MSVSFVWREKKLCFLKSKYSQHSNHSHQNDLYMYNCTQPLTHIYTFDSMVPWFYWIISYFIVIIFIATIRSNRINKSKLIFWLFYSGSVLLLFLERRLCCICLTLRFHCLRTVQFIAEWWRSKRVLNRANGRE